MSKSYISYRTMCDKEGVSFLIKEYFSPKITLKLTVFCISGDPAFVVRTNRVNLYIF